MVLNAQISLSCTNKSAVGLDSSIRHKIQSISQWTNLQSLLDVQVGGRFVKHIDVRPLNYNDSDGEPDES